MSCVLLAVVLLVLGGRRYFSYRYAVDQLAGAVAALLLAVTYFDSGDRRSAVTRFLSWRPLVQIGLFSYSLYLVHAVALHALWLILHRWLAVSPERMFLLLLSCTPLVVGFAWLFHLACERPFLRGRSAP